MKLLTTIPARRDGTLSVTGADGTVYEGSKNSFGDIEFDIPCELTIASLLAGGKFYPADEDDFDVAETLLGGGDGDDESDEDADDEADAGNANSLPVEANTPPSAATPKNASKKKK